MATTWRSSAISVTDWNGSHGNCSSANASRQPASVRDREHGVERVHALRLVLGAARDVREARIGGEVGPVDRAAEVGPVPVGLQEAEREEPAVGAPVVGGERVRRHRARAGLGQPGRLVGALQRGHHVGRERPDGGGEQRDVDDGALARAFAAERAPPRCRTRAAPRRCGRPSRRAAPIGSGSPCGVSVSPEPAPGPERGGVVRGLARRRGRARRSRDHARRSRRGLTARRSSTPRPSRSRLDGSEFVRNTSACSTRRSRISRPSAVFRSRPTLRFPRFAISIETLTAPARRADALRHEAAVAVAGTGCSILTTSAPQSASSAPVTGTNTNCATSTTRTPPKRSTGEGRSSLAAAPPG